jgi:DNA-binding GntR family transcriptional regulator
MRLKRISTDRTGLPVEYSKIVFHADRYQFIGRMQRSGREPGPMERTS